MGLPFQNPTVGSDSLPGAALHVVASARSHADDDPDFLVRLRRPRGDIAAEVWTVAALASVAGLDAQARVDRAAGGPGRLVLAEVCSVNMARHPFDMPATIEDWLAALAAAPQSKELRMWPNLVLAAINPDGERPRRFPGVTGLCLEHYPGEVADFPPGPRRGLPAFPDLAKVSIGTMGGAPWDVGPEVLAAELEWAAQDLAATPAGVKEVDILSALSCDRIAVLQRILEALPELEAFGSVPWHELAGRAPQGAPFHRIRSLAVHDVDLDASDEASRSAAGAIAALFPALQELRLRLPFDPRAGPPVSPPEEGSPASWGAFATAQPGRRVVLEGEGWRGGGCATPEEFARAVQTACGGEREVVWEEVVQTMLS